MYAALGNFGASIEGLSAKDFAEPDNFFRMGTPPVMVDIMPKIGGVEFEDAFDALRESSQSQELEQHQSPASPVTSARDELEQFKKDGREDCEYRSYISAFMLI